MQKINSICNNFLVHFSIGIREYTLNYLLEENFERWVKEDQCFFKVSWGSAFYRRVKELHDSELYLVVLRIGNFTESLFLARTFNKL